MTPLQLLRSRFPRASASCIKANHDVAAQHYGEGLADAPKRKARAMNKTEGAFASLLQAKVNRGEIVSFQYEGMRLAWSGMHYTPDFVVINKEPVMYLAELQPLRLTFYEVKGAHIYSRDMVRFRGCRAEWPLFEFQMWQYKSREWTRLL